MNDASAKLAAEACNLLANWIETGHIAVSANDVLQMDAASRRQLRLGVKPLGASSQSKVNHLRGIAEHLLTSKGTSDGHDSSDPQHAHQSS